MYQGNAVIMMMMLIRVSDEMKKPELSLIHIAYCIKHKLPAMFRSIKQPTRHNIFVIEQVLEFLSLRFAKHWNMPTYISKNY